MIVQLRRNDALATRGVIAPASTPIVHVGRAAGTVVQTGKYVEASGYERATAGASVALFGTAAYFLFRSGHWIWGSLAVLVGSWSVPTLVSGQTWEPDGAP